MIHAGYVLHSANFSASRTGGSVALDCAGRLSPAAGSEDRLSARARVPAREMLQDCTHQSQAHTHLIHFRIVPSGYVLDSSNYYGNSPGRAGPLAGAGRLRPAAGSGTKAPMRQPHETLRDRTRLSQAPTQLVPLPFRHHAEVALRSGRLLIS